MKLKNILMWNEKTLELAVNALKNGNLVAFPTETVFGLGANALDKTAIEKIFLAKQRPKSDPLIVHIPTRQRALELTNVTNEQEKCFVTLAKKFWPGPLTIIVRKNDLISELVTGGNDYVGLRIPNHAVALELLKNCDCPIAAPSANLFGHTSPTSAEHVWNDLKDFDNLLIIDSNIPCQIGIESTIIKIVSNDEIQILRPGFINEAEIKNELLKNDLKFKINVKRRIINDENTKNIEASGQFLKHYSPKIISFVFNSHDEQFILKNKDFLKSTVFIDYNSKYLKYESSFLSYFDLSVKGDLKEATFNLFTILRMAEVVKNAQCILLPNFSLQDGELAIALWDRIYRAASGKFY